MKPKRHNAVTAYDQKPSGIRTLSKGTVTFLRKETDVKHMQEDPRAWQEFLNRKLSKG